MIGRSSFRGSLGILQEKVLVCTVFSTTMLVLASLFVPSLTLVCVCACSCVGVSISYVESLNLRVGLWWTWFRDSTFISGTVHVLLCNEAVETSFSLVVEGEAVQIRF